MGSSPGSTAPSEYSGRTRHRGCRNTNSALSRCFRRKVRHRAVLDLSGSHCTGMDSIVAAKARVRFHRHILLPCAGRIARGYPELHKRLVDP